MALAADYAVSPIVTAFWIVAGLGLSAYGVWKLTGGGEYPSLPRRRRIAAIMLVWVLYGLVILGVNQLRGEAYRRSGLVGGLVFLLIGNGARIMFKRHAAASNGADLRSVNDDLGA